MRYHGCYYFWSIVLRWADARIWWKLIWSKSTLFHHNTHNTLQIDIATNRIKIYRSVHSHDVFYLLITCLQFGTTSLVYMTMLLNDLSKPQTDDNWVDTIHSSRVVVVKSMDDDGFLVVNCANKKTARIQFEKKKILSNKMLTMWLVFVAFVG